MRPFLQGAVHHVVLGSSLRRINGCLQEDPTSKIDYISVSSILACYGECLVFDSEMSSLL